YLAAGLGQRDTHRLVEEVKVLCLCARRVRPRDRRNRRPRPDRRHRRCGEGALVDVHCRLLWLVEHDMQSTVGESSRRRPRRLTVSNTWEVRRCRPYLVPAVAAAARAGTGTLADRRQPRAPWG